MHSSDKRDKRRKLRWDSWNSWFASDPDSRDYFGLVATRDTYVWNKDAVEEYTHRLKRQRQRQRQRRQLEWLLIKNASVVNEDNGK